MLVVDTEIEIFVINLRKAIYAHPENQTTDTGTLETASSSSSEPPSAQLPPTAQFHIRDFEVGELDFPKSQITRAQMTYMEL